MSAYDKLEGEEVTLKRVTESGFDALFARFRDRRYYAACGLKKAPTADDLRSDLFDDESLVAWDVFPEGAEASVGYVLYIAFDGPPYVQILFFDGSLDLTVAREAMALAVHAFFKHTKEPQLHVFLPLPVSEELHELLTEGGFDRLEEHPTINLEVEAAYVMERHTYDAYYGELDDEDEESDELDFG